MPIHFIKPKKEEIICEKCGKKFLGGGYVNHCPKCLWSKHVDKKIPGDRKSDCLGIMKPIDIIIKKRGEISIKHQCIKCGKERLNKASKNDDMDKIIELSHDKHGNL